MDQVKTGALIRKLRIGKGLTQKQPADMINFSDKAVSKWECGRTMPDISIIIELADYYGIDIRELLNGERKSEDMNKDVKETLIMVADYTDKQKKRAIARAMLFFGSEMLCCGYTIAIIIMIIRDIRLSAVFVAVPLLLTAVFAFMLVMNAKDHVRSIQKVDRDKR